MLKEYSDADFELLETWITDEDILFTFSGTDWNFPLTREQISDYQATRHGRAFYIGYTDDGEPFAIGEIILEGIYSPRLARILVGSKHQRGIGLGTRFVSALLDKCLAQSPSDHIHLFVVEDNYTAIRCYEKVGFKFNPETELAMNFKGETHKVLKMTFDRKAG